MQYLTWAYVILIYAFLPLFMPMGYFQLGEYKGLAYMYISGALAVITLIFLLVKRAIRLPGKQAGMDAASYAAICYGASIILSYIFSLDKKESLLGLEGWRTGALSLLLMLFGFYIFSQFVKLNTYLVVAIFITPALEIILGLLNRFSVYPLDIYGMNYSFLATIGNINWYSGYLSIFVPAAVGLAYTMDRKAKALLPLQFFCFLGLMALLTQGSDSALLILLGTYGLLFLFSLEERKLFRSFLFQMTVLGVAMEISNLLAVILTEWFTYRDSVMINLCHYHVGLILIAAVLLLYRLSRLFEEINVPWKSKVYRIATLSVYVISGIAAGVILFKNYDYNLGNSRGIIWSISADIYKSLSPWQKLVGVGPDGFFGYAYSNQEILDSLFTVFGANTLTNAHSEILTILIERGLVGLVTYLGFIGTGLWTLWKNKRECKTVVFALPVFAYFCNGLVSFSQITSTPYMFMALGLGLGIIRHGNGVVKLVEKASGAN